MNIPVCNINYLGGLFMKRSKVLWVFVICLVSLSIFANGKQDASAGDEVDKPVTIEMMVGYWDVEVPNEESPAFLKVEELTNTNLDINWVNYPSSYIEKFGLTLASGDLPEVIMLPGGGQARAQNVVEAINGGMFWELGPLLSDYEYLSQIDSDVLKGTSYNGKVYALPRQTIKRDGGAVIREDWLDTLGMEIPETLDEFYEVLKAFVNDDPDQNGKDDTYGAYLTGTWFVGHFTLMTGGNPNWYIENGKVLPPFYQEEYLESMKFMKKIYDEKLINNDFIATKTSDTRDKFNSSQAGIIGGSIGQVSSGNIFTPLFKSHPDAKLNLMNVFKDPSGQRVCSEGPGLWTGFAMPVRSVKEDKLDKILTFFDQCRSPELVEIFAAGIEGIDYAKEGDKYVLLDYDSWKKNTAPLVSLYTAPIIVESLKLGYNDNDIEFYERLTDESIKGYPAIDRWFSASVPTAQLTTIIDDAVARFVIGEIDEAGFQDAIDDWKSQGGEALIEDYTRQYNLFNN
jgi:putative aldouronate transport system substrate-binding protein